MLMSQYLKMIRNEMKESDYSELYLDAKLAINNTYKLCLTGHWEDAVKAADAASQICKQLQELLQLKQGE